MAQNVSTEQVIKDHNDLPTDLSDFDMESTQNIISSNNKYSSSESLYHQSSSHNRVSNYGSIQGLPTVNDETINIINSDKNKKIHRKCITTCAVVIGVFLISSGIGTGLLLKSYTPTQLITTSLKIGDEMSYNIYNPALIILDSSIASIVITLIDSHDDTVVVYTATTIPNKHMKYLPENTIPELSGPSRYNYNYFSADEPIYLQPQSVLLYDLLIFISTHSNCPARLDEPFRTMAERSVCESHEIIIGGTSERTKQDDVILMITELGIAKNDFQVKKVTNEEQYYKITADYNTIKRVYSGRDRFPKEWYIQDQDAEAQLQSLVGIPSMLKSLGTQTDTLESFPCLKTPSQHDPLVVSLTYSTASSSSESTREDWPKNFIQKIQSSHTMSYGIVVEVHDTETRAFYNDMFSSTSTTQPVIKVDIRGLISSCPGIDTVKTICETIRGIWVGYCISLTTNCKDDQVKVVLIPSSEQLPF